MNETQRGTLRRRVAVDFSDGLSGTTSGNGAADGTTSVDAARIERDSYWKGGEIFITSGTNADVSRRITNSVSTGTLTHAAFAAQVLSGVTYELFFAFTLAQYNDAIDSAVRRAQGTHWMPMLWDGLTIVANTFDYALPVRDGTRATQTITIDAGSTTSALRDSALTQANDFWNGARVVGRSGTAANIGQVRNVSDFLAATDDLVLDSPLPATPAAADTFQLFWPEMRYIYAVEYIPSGATLPIAVPDRDWQIIHRGTPMLRFTNGALPPVSSTVRVYALRMPEPPVHDRDPVEVPDDYALNLTYWQLLRSRSRRPDLKLDDDGSMKREAWDKAQIELKRMAYQKPAYAKRVF